ncbi:UvrD-helicase domain-containing protein [Aerosakkonema funiforme]|uniref:UvrD-like helicase ATP-binding domain-containing protein n=1 Tax=Aerosakkonema funiforme FACHB-1375 TaxID=2949571 RepID=A0A926ZK66_9CYAN|nr:UvrD-helicase domain-containing protein [Aerosakkonema funiforme]MBD2185585.1 hypothetical protein [Aerosakkonema funiforme FACHB-1375]
MTVFYVYLTKQCSDDATNHGVIEDIKKFAEKLEKDQSTRGLDPFPKPYWKKAVAKGRIVIEEYPLNEEDIILLCLSRYFVRGDREYELFCEDPEKFGNKNKISESEVKEIIEQRKQQPITPKQDLSHIELQYLQSTSSHHLTDDVVFLESYDWVERISQEDIKDYLLRYYDLIFNSLISKIADGEWTSEGDLVEDSKNSKIKILYRYFPEHRRILLISPLNANNNNDQEELREKYKDILGNSQVELEKIVRRSRRAYPSLITYFDDTWMQVQKSAEANLALSPEEESILELISNSGSGSLKYPLFINGRPGSGKSTILQYLFSEHLTQYLKISDSNSLPNPPLYLTYSTPLLKQARSCVENILKCGAKHIEDGYNLQDNQKLEHILQQSFRDFHKFLLEQLPVQLKENFVPANYINFERFRKEWDIKRKSHPESKVRKISSELAWHAIRTFIKGMQNESGAEIDPEFYEFELDRDAKSISDKTFKLIYHNVWEKWYKPRCEEEGWWDDQDLAHKVLEHSTNELSRYPAVFCDEAQDFTSIELELIERLSLYSDRKLPSHRAKDVPFAFAGDPFQTLNPTGFNWNAAQASFHKNIVQQLDSSGSAKLKFNFQELSFNYRSSEQIVKLANLIQLLRGRLLRIKGLRPQQSWTGQETISPVCFRANDASCQNAIREQEELVIIIPCQENGEQEYVKGDNFLSSFALENEQVFRNILSPARAKGLEYKRVLLYKFGEEVIKRVPELLQHINDPNREPPEIDKRLEWEYFLNQFYVAVSRARKRLFIVDSDQALNEFWKFTDIQKQRELLTLYQNINSNEQWSLENIGGIIKGDDSSWSDDRDDPLRLAEDYEAQGRSQRDEYLLNLARSNYHRANRPEKANLCQAAAYEFSEDFAKAGNLFKELGRANDACRCYWSGKDAPAITNLFESFPEIANDPRYIASSVITQNQNTVQRVDPLLTALENVQSLVSEGSREISAWQWFFEELITKVEQAIEPSSEDARSSWRPLVEGVITTLNRLNFSPKDHSNIAKLYYSVGEFQKTVTYWAEYSRTQKKPQQPIWVTRSWAKIEPYPQNIKYYHQLQDYKAVIDAWRSADRPISETPVNLILECAGKIGDLAAIRSLLPACNDIGKVTDLIKETKSELINEAFGAIIVAFFQCLEKNSDWSNIVRFACERKLDLKNLKGVQKQQYESLYEQLEKVKIEQYVTIAAAVRVLARSERLAAEAAEKRDYNQIISNFLESYLIVDDHTTEKQAIMQSVHSIIEIKEVGAAFERAFKLTSALKYYDQLFKNDSFTKKYLAPSDEDILFAQRRWIKCKYRLADLPETAQDKIKADRLRKEADQLANKFGISNDPETDYPELGAIAELNIPTCQKENFSEPYQPETIAPNAIALTGESPEPEKLSTYFSVKGELELVVKDLKLKVEIKMQKQRVSLTRVDTEDHVSCSPKKVSSEDVSVEQLQDISSTVKVWEIKEWNIQCEIQAYANNCIIRLKTSEGKPIIGFELPKISS